MKRDIASAQWRSCTVQAIPVCLSLVLIYSLKENGDSFCHCIEILTEKIILVFPPRKSLEYRIYPSAAFRLRRKAVPSMYGFDFWLEMARAMLNRCEDIHNHSDRRLFPTGTLLSVQQYLEVSSFYLRSVCWPDCLPSRDGEPSVCESVPFFDRQRSFSLGDLVVLSFYPWFFLSVWCRYKGILMDLGSKSALALKNEGSTRIKQKERNVDSGLPKVRFKRFRA